MSGYTTDYALVWQTSYNLFINLHWENIAPFIQRTEGALQTLAFKKQLHLKIWILAVKSLQLQIYNFLEDNGKQFYFWQWKWLRESSDLLSQYRHFKKLVLGLQSKNTQILMHSTVFQTLFQEQIPGFKTPKSFNSCRHPDGVGADAGCILDVPLIQAFKDHTQMNTFRVVRFFRKKH